MNWVYSPLIAISSKTIVNLAFQFTMVGVFNHRASSDGRQAHFRATGSQRSPRL